MTKKKIDKFSKQVERISTKRGTIKESVDGRQQRLEGVCRVIEEIVDICTDVSYRRQERDLSNIEKIIYSSP